MTRHIAFARWRSEVPSGGNRYDDELTSSLTALGVKVREHPVAGSWPFPDQHARDRFQAMLASGSTGLKSHWLIDNIVAAAVPELLRAAVDAGRKVSVIMHYFVADERELSPAVRSRLAAGEAAAVTAASAVLATSEWTAREVARRYGRTDVTVAVPGVTSTHIAPGSLCGGRPPQLLWLARLTQTKDPLTFIAALADVQDLAWSAQLVGPNELDPALSRTVQHRIAASGLSGRIEMTGACEGAVLESVWSQTDLLVHTARTEAYGMVVSEALARGIPSIVPLGTGAIEAQQGVGSAFTPGDAGELSRVLRAWLMNSQQQGQWRSEALVRRPLLPTWEGAARIVANALTP